MSEEDKQQAGSPWGPANPQALNRYSYVQNNPLRYTDPTGHCFWDLCIVETYAAATVIAAVATYVGIQYYNYTHPIAASTPISNLPAAPAATKKDDNNTDGQREETPDTNPERFENVRGTAGKKDTETGEIWALDRLHKDHYEVYKNLRDYEKGIRDRDVWRDGRPKRKF